MPFYSHRDKPACSSTITLLDGRKLGYAQYGARNGKAIFYLHCFPGSCKEAALFDEPATKLDLRLIAVDRPGMGWSSAQPGRTLLDHAKDIEVLAEHLKLDEYGILGMSGGGTYALACAAILPASKLKVVSVVCALGPPDIGYSGMKRFNRLGFEIGLRNLPPFLSSTAKRDIAVQSRTPDNKQLESLTSHSSKWIAQEDDLKAVKHDCVRPPFARSTRKRVAQGVKGFLQEGYLLCTDFGFRIEDIRTDLRVQLWYGKRDTNVPFRHGEGIAARLGAKAQLRIEDKTHVGILVNCRENILKDLVRYI